MSDDLKYRLGTGPGGPNLEDGLEWAAANDFHFLDFNADHGPNALSTWTAERIRAVRQYCEQHDLHLGIHTLSGVNVAEFSPYMSEAVDAYIRANVDASQSPRRLTSRPGAATLSARMPAMDLRGGRTSADCGTRRGSARRGSARCG